MTKKINTHKLLRGYHEHPEYHEIAQFAGGMARKANKKEILKAVRERYGAGVELQTMREASQPITLFGELGTDIPYNAYEQMQTALSIPPATRGVMMPDAHHGYSVPIGGVVELENAISPAYIGFDISCMVMLTTFDISQTEFMQHREQIADDLRNETAFGIGSAFDNPRKHKVMEDRRWNEIEVMRKLKRKAAEQLGSSGGGNHFADLVLGEWLKTEEKFVGLMTHSGSRGTGHKAATHYTKLADRETQQRSKGVPRGYGWLDMDTEAGQEYWEVMQLMGQYTFANHELIHQHFAERSGLKATQMIWNRHNYAWEKDGLFVHRKGATPAEDGVEGIVPGTSGTNSYVVAGLGNPESLYSSSHGAGRPHSRTEAKRRHDKKMFAKHMHERDILYFGLAPDETFMAYKDIETVLGLQDGVLLDRLAVMQPKVVIMGGKADDGD